MRKFIISFLLLAVIVTQVSCGGVDVQTHKKPTTETVSLDGGLLRRIDKEAGVVCWSLAASLSCMPIEDTKLGDGEQ